MQQDFEGTVDHLNRLLDLEISYYAPCVDYLSVVAASSPCSASTSVSSLGSASAAENDIGSLPVSSSRRKVDRVNEAWRRKMCEWCFEVVDHFGMEREVVSVAMNYLDRIAAKYMIAQSNDRFLNKREFQLVAVSSLYLAVKLHGETDEIDIDRRKLNVDVFVDLSRGYFQAETLKTMELNILFHLDWRLNPPTPLKFIAFLMRLIPSWSSSDYDEGQPSYKSVFKAIFDIAMYLTELSVCVSTFTFQSRSSVVAYASILCALDALKDTLPLPYEARLGFVNQVAEATGFLPESEQVRCVRNLLKELCPAIEERDVESIIGMGDFDDEDAGKSSPVCVSHVVPQDLASRKHTRF